MTQTEVLTYRGSASPPPSALPPGPYEQGLVVEMSMRATSVDSPTRRFKPIIVGRPPWPLWTVGRGEAFQPSSTFPGGL